MTAIRWADMHPNKLAKELKFDNIAKGIKDMTTVEQLKAYRELLDNYTGWKIAGKSVYYIQDDLAKMLR